MLTPFRTADPYSRLRVPVYRKAFEAAFFVSFLLLYYAVLIERNPTRVGVFEGLLYVWIAAFAYDELSGFVDSGMLFYQMTFWNLWDLCIIGTGLVFVITSKSAIFRICLTKYGVSRWTVAGTAGTCAKKRYICVYLTLQESSA
jgi:hypothetical protein